MWWWITHFLKVGALNVTYGGVTQITQAVVVVALLTWELGQLIIYGASGKVILTLNMVAKVTQVIGRRRGRRKNPMLNRLIVVAVDDGRRWHIITLTWMKAEDGTSSLSPPKMEASSLLATLSLASKAWSMRASVVVLIAAPS